MTKLMITDTVLRDAHQSLLATRMRTEDMIPIYEKLDKVGYWSLEMFGGATFDSMMRFFPLLCSKRSLDYLSETFLMFWHL